MAAPGKKQKLTDDVVKKLTPPETGYEIHYDVPDKNGNVVRGFGVRITANGARAFILNYRRKSDGRERRKTIGSYPAWTVAAALEEAKRLRRAVDSGRDPLGEEQERRTAPTVAEMCDRFIEEHVPKKRPSTQVDYRSMINVHIRTRLGDRKVADLSFEDIEGMHRALTKRGSPYRANRTVSLLSKMLSLAVRWKWRADNPASGIERNQETKRRRYLKSDKDEVERLINALAADPDQQAANIFRLLLLTGARRGEVLVAKWEDINLKDGIWTKPGATTKTKTEHQVPLSAPARQLLASIQRTDSPYVFPSPREKEGHRVEVKYSWRRICKRAGLADLRIHDLRHSYASQLVSAGFGLPIIGALLGHTQAQTTHRYAHLFDDPLRKATESVGAVLSGKPSGDVVALKGGGRG
jgi:integrase